MARGNLSRQQLIKEALAQLAETDPKLAEVITSAGELGRIQDGMGRVYTLVPEAETRRISGHSQTGPQRLAARQAAIEDASIRNTVIVNGEEYVIENYLRGTRKVDSTTPALVLQEKQRLYPEKLGLSKIPQADIITDDSLISMLIADHRRNQIDPNTGQMRPAISMEYEDRKAPDDLMEALDAQGMLKSGPLGRLTGAGITEERKKRQRQLGLPTRTREQGVKIRRALIGDIDRNINPRTLAPYGDPVVQNGRLVRDQLQAGHGFGFNTNPEKADDVNNLAMELAPENLGTAAEEKGHEVPMELVFKRALGRAQDQGKNLGPLRQKVDALARAGQLDQRRVNELIAAVLMPPRS